jgi:hypothetical protein
LAHIAYAQEYLSKHSELDEQRLMRGTMFPDIRAIAGLPREKTHRSNVTMAEIELEPDSWRVGWLLHNYLDDIWNEHFYAYGMRVGENEEMWLALKIAEEVGLFEKIQDRDKLAQHFDGVADSDELAFGASEESIKIWDDFIVWKLTAPFEVQIWKERAKTIGFDDEAATDALAGRIQIVVADPVWRGRFETTHLALGYGQVVAPG